MNRWPPLIGAVVAGVLAIPATGALGDLAQARAGLADVRAVVAGGGPAAIAPVASAFPADDAGDARTRLAARVRADAARGGVLVESLTGDAGDRASVTTLTLRASGPEKALLAFADALERGSPAVRMHGWRLTPAPGGVRLDATLVAPWRG